MCTSWEISSNISWKIIADLSLTFFFSFFQNRYFKKAFRSFPGEKIQIILSKSWSLRLHKFAGNWLLVRVAAAYKCEWFKVRIRRDKFILHRCRVLSLSPLLCAPREHTSMLIMITATVMPLNTVYIDLVMFLRLIKQNN